ncbi:MAG TPA: amino acid adenylation domain-containing protein [Pyrinomonadaceae bacterium]|nr:amino acid adenylation domain-containing protein [Pyrinomonadaceae bacterium]
MSFESVQRMFSRTAAEFGPRAAIERGGRRVTYAELETESNRLANYLLEHGAGKGVIVGLLTSDPARIITAILGVLKAGAVFVPFDPTFPDGRLRAMSEQVEPQHYVTERKYLDKLDQLHTGAKEIVCFDDDDYASYQRSEHPNVASDEDAPCSIYFTSGSTGKPKAILGRLKGIDHYMRWEIAAVGAGPGTRVSQLASPAFDGFLKDAFVPLCSGGTVCAPESRSLILSATHLADWLDIEQVEVLHCVPSVFRALLNENLDSRYFEAMKSVVLAGEALYPADVKRWMDIFGERIKLLNVYGPTETTVLKVAYEVKAEDVERPSIPIGKPIKGSAVMLINSRGQLCHGEAVGEIHIRTPYRSHGYYGAPELTSEVFIRNPFSDDPSDILYKTGDYGRLLEDGNLEFLGRRDQQVQVRGVRVELGEIENLLRGHAAVADVAVVDRDDAEGNKFLVAFITANDGTSTAPLRQYLMERLPEAMIPSAIVDLDQLPRTLNGKVDRKALRSLDLQQLEPDDDAGGSLTPIEEIVSGIWCEVLRLPSIARNGNFFNLGGHSLLVTQVLARVREYLGVELPIRSLFEAPTLAQFARSIDEQISSGERSELPPITPVSRDGALPLSFSQQRMWFFEQLSSGTSAFNIALGVRLTGSLNFEALEQTFSEIIRRHEILRTVFAAGESEPVQIIQAPEQFELRLVDLGSLTRDEAERQAARLAQEEILRVFDLRTGPLVRPTLLKIDEEEHIIICTMHHIVGDGQSFEVVILEMSQIYSMFCDGQPSPLLELSLQYVDYAVWQRQWLQGEELEKRLDYWWRQLEDAPHKLSLPHRRARPKAQGFKGGRHATHLSPAETEALRDLSRREGMTMFMTMLSGFVLLLKQYTGDDDIVVGSVYGNRERADLEQLIGILNNTLVLRVNLSGAETFADVMKRVREVCLDAYTYQVPPELIKEDMVKRGAERERLFDAWFQLEKPRQEQFDMRGLSVTPYHEANEVTRFELALGFMERDGALSGAIEYDENMFTTETTRQMLDDYVQVMTLMVANPNGEISTVSLTTNDEIEQLSSSFVASLEI